MPTLCGARFAYDGQAPCDEWVNHDGFREDATGPSRRCPAQRAARQRHVPVLASQGKKPEQRGGLPVVPDLPVCYPLACCQG